MYIPHTIPDILVALGTLLTGAAAIWAASTAHRGLASWKSQQVWLRDSDLVKRLLIALYERRDAIGQIRSSFGSISREALTNKKKRYEETKSDYQRRMKSLSTARNSFYANGNEARALWGDELDRLTQKLLSLQAELFVTVEDHVNRLDPETFEEDDRTKEEKLKDINLVYARGGERDVFGKEYEAAILLVEEHLRGKISA